MRSEWLEWPPKRRLIFSDRVKKLLRKPAGQLISGDPNEVARKIKEIIEAEKPPVVIAVGDYTSRKLRDAGARVSIYVIDGKTERRPSAIFDASDLEVVRCVNKAGTLDPDACLKLHNLLTRKSVRNVVLAVEGEEDLLTLAAILSAPEGSMIIYGQPGAGSVIIRVSREEKEKAFKILELVIREREQV